MFDLSGRIALVSGAAQGMGRAMATVLASDASSWITGALIPIDGGDLAMNPGATIPE
jgi:NAD(P)-dependent dehydrogenase (short-subunit alcohol dehydrogenase family)